MQPPRRSSRRSCRPAKLHVERAPRAVTLAIAHRGASVAAPENTMAAFQLAAEMGSRAIELDVHLTADGHVVVIHDATLDRTTDARGAVAELSLAQVQAADAGHRYSPDGRSYPFRGAGLRVPALAEVVEWLPADVALVVEIKARAAVEATVRLLVERGVSERATVISFDAGAIERSRALDATLPTGLLIPPGAPFEGGLQQVVGAGHLSLNVFETDLGLDPRPLVERAAAVGKRLGCYVIDDPQRMRVVAAAGLSAFVTNRPDVAREALRG